MVTKPKDRPPPTRDIVRTGAQSGEESPANGLRSHRPRELATASLGDTPLGGPSDGLPTCGCIDAKRRDVEVSVRVLAMRRARFGRDPARRGSMTWKMTK